MRKVINSMEAAAGANESGRPRRPWAGSVATLVLGAVAWVALLVAMGSHHPADPAFSTSGALGGWHNRLGAIGAWVSDALYFLLGYSAWWLVVMGAREWLSALAARIRLAQNDGVQWVDSAGSLAERMGRGADASAGPAAETALRWIGRVLLLASSAALEYTRLYAWEDRLPGAQGGGVLGYHLGQSSQSLLGFDGAGLLWIVVLVGASATALRFSWLHWAEALGRWVESLYRGRQERLEQAEDRRAGQEALRERIEEAQIEVDEAPHWGIAPLVIEPEPKAEPPSIRVQAEKQKILFTDLQGSALPAIDLLDQSPVRTETIGHETLEMTSRLIEKKLRDFGVEVQVVAAAPGPVITRYEIEPATGVKGSQIVNLAKDLARSLGLVSLRVVETVPGKTTMALELPNPKRHTIHLTEILGSQAYHDAASLLTMGLGKDIVGKPVVADLAKMPHCLVAGTTGSGKSVGINGMILSLLYKAEPRDVRLIMIDPKMLELSVYEAIPHLLCPVVTDMRQAHNALNWAVGEMERRYKLMSRMGVRNLSGFNKKIEEAKERGEHIPNPFSLTPEQPEPLDHLPHIVVVIDELADLMMVVGKKVEELIARLAQKARASGIHLILATQRPSVDVITGLIKANIPTRISFQVSSKIDSRTILDQMGAEALLGMGDMLYMASGTGLPVRVHGAFVSDEEVHRVVAFLRSRGDPQYIEGILEGGTLEEDSAAPGSASGSGNAESDPLYDQAVAVVLQNKRASISLVQRHLRIGYNRAARLLEQMEKSGLVSAMATNGNRDILAPRGPDNEAPF